MNPTAVNLSNRNLITAEQQMIRGSVLIVLKKFVYKKVGVDDALLFYSNIQNIIPHQIVPTKLYSLDILLEIEHKLCLFLNISLEELLLESTSWLLKEDLGSIYKSLLRLGGPEKIFHYGELIAKNYYNLSQLKVVHNESGFLKYKVCIESKYLEWSIYGYKGAAVGILDVCGYTLTESNLTIIDKEYKMVRDDVIELSVYTMELRYSKGTC